MGYSGLIDGFVARGRASEVASVARNTDGPTIFIRTSRFTGPKSGFDYKVFQRSIDPDLLYQGRTNLQQMRDGNAPFVLKDGKYTQVQLHHSKQDARGPLFEISRTTHSKNQRLNALHPHRNPDMPNVQGKHPDYPVNHSQPQSI